MVLGVTKAVFVMVVDGRVQTDFCSFLLAV